LWNHVVLEQCTVRSSSFTNFCIHSKRKFHCYQLWHPTEAEKLFFYHDFFLKYHLYVTNICAKFWGQKIHPRKDIHSLPTCVVLNFYCCQLCHLLKDWNFFFAKKFLSLDHLYVDNIFAKSQVQNIYSKKGIRNLPTCVVVTDNFTIANFERPS